LDCSGIYYKSDCEKHLCVVKLIDSTINPLLKDPSLPKSLTMTCFSRQKTDLPRFTKVGQIVRVHRCFARHFMTCNQLNCDTDFCSAWLIFDQQVSNHPIQLSSYSYTFAHDDNLRLAEIRSFAMQFFNDYNASAYINKQMPSKTDIDGVAKVLDRTNKGRVSRLRLYDGNTFFKLTIKSHEYPEIEPECIIYVRGMGIKNGRYTYNEFTGILIVPNDHATARKMNKKIKKKCAKNSETRAKVLEYIKIMDNDGVPKIIVMSTVAYSTMPLIPLKALFNKSDKNEEGCKFRVKVCPLEIWPKDTKEWIKSTPSHK